MELGIIGLGRMGSGIALRLLDSGHRVVGFDADPTAAADLEPTGWVRVFSIEELIDGLDRPAAIWLMLPAGKSVDDSLDQITKLAETGSIVIDGGNSNYKESMRRSRALAAVGLQFVDVGTSGGVWGRSHGYCLTIGGDPSAVERLRPIFEALAPDPDRGWGQVGPAGAGHFVKMIHNGIEYGLMQAYAEGFAVLEKKSELHLDLAQISDIWNRGSVIRSWLLELITEALRTDASLAHLGSRVADSGEGRWAASEAIDLDVPAPVMTLSLLARLQSRDREAFSAKLLQAMRQQFGGHPPSDD